jgi:hypothetical protein
VSGRCRKATPVTAHPGLTQAQHRVLPFVSNTDLSTLRDEALGLTHTGNPQALIIGSAFHEAVLDPHRYHAPQGLPRPSYACSIIWPPPCAANATAATCSTGAPLS